MNAFELIMFFIDEIDGIYADSYWKPNPISIVSESDYGITYWITNEERDVDLDQRIILLPDISVFSSYHVEISCFVIQNEEEWFFRYFVTYDDYKHVTKEYGDSIWTSHLPRCKVMEAFLEIKERIIIQLKPFSALNGPSLLDLI